MIKDNHSQSFSSRLRLTALMADWERLADQLTAEELLKFSGNPLLAINAIAEEVGCELSSVGLEKSVELRFVRRYGCNKVMLNIRIDRDLFSDPSLLEEMLRAMLPKQVAVANDKNTILEYFGPAASN